ncbi:MAG: hypothetical protein ACE369_01220 [Roseovarius sp.]
MVNTSKILTVSYGTFSCTLEGFDDSFETMKAIAEYFRDLAADDRYFGAEPPTPDAEMLARIAEREISRRVEAREDHGNIHLRADENSGSTEMLTHAAPMSEEPKTEPPAVANEAFDDMAGTGETGYRPETDTVAPRDDASIAASPEDLPAEVSNAQAGGEAVAPEHEQETKAEEKADVPATEHAVPQETNAEDADDEAVMDPTGEPPAEYRDEVQQEELSDSSFAAEMEAFIASAETDETDPADSSEIATGSDVPDAEAFDKELGQYSSSADTEAYDETEVSPVRVLDTDSVAEKLRRIRSVVSQSDLDYTVSSYSEDEYANGVSDAASDELEALLSEEYDETYEDFDSTLGEPEDLTIQSAFETEDEDLVDDPIDAAIGQDRSDDDTLDAMVAGLGERSEDEDQAAAEDMAQAEDVKAGDIGHDDDDDTLEADVISRPVVDEDALSQLMADAAPAETDEVEPKLAEETELDELAESPAQHDALEFDASDHDDAAKAEDEPDTVADITPFVLGKDARVPALDTDDQARPLNARVLKMKRSDFEMAIAQGAIEEEADVQDRPEDPGDEAILSPEEEADLQRELAEVEAELAETTPAATIDANVKDADDRDSDDDAVFETADDEGDRNRAEAEGRSDAPADDDDAGEDLEIAALLADEAELTAESDAIVDAEPLKEDETTHKPRRGLSRLLGMGKRAPEDEERIFEEADSQMGDKDASMRRTAIQHLRAAVAATKAEKSAGVDVDQSVDETPYRSDLAEVVRPRRPSATGSRERSERPGDQRAAPLKLVAEQRVDTERAPVRPRRVAALSSAAPQSTDGGFTAFAEDMGVSNLSDLLEAAAAYMSDVEGHSEFTRPMLMGKLKEVNSGNYSREDGLRSFGQLLRQGKLRKVPGGRFTATDETEFRAEARNVG